MSIDVERDGDRFYLDIGDEGRVELNSDQARDLRDDLKEAVDEWKFDGYGGLLDRLLEKSCGVDGIVYVKAILEGDPEHSHFRPLIRCAIDHPDPWDMPDTAEARDEWRRLQSEYRKEVEQAFGDDYDPEISIYIDPKDRVTPGQAGRWSQFYDDRGEIDLDWHLIGSFFLFSCMKDLKQSDCRLTGDDVGQVSGEYDTDRGVGRSDPIGFPYKEGQYRPDFHKDGYGGCIAIRRILAAEGIRPGEKEKVKMEALRPERWRKAVDEWGEDPFEIGKTIILCEGASPVASLEIEDNRLTYSK